MKFLTNAIAIAVMISTTSSICVADISMNIWDDGTDLFMSASGDYDLTNATPQNNVTLGANAAIGVNLLYGWEVANGFGATGYTASYSGTLTGVGSIFPASSVSVSNPFFFWQSAGTINVDNNNPISGTVDNTAVFANRTLASLGMVEGESISVTWGNGGANERGTITVGAVPEPSTAAFGIIGLGAFLIRRRTV